MKGRYEKKRRRGSVFPLLIVVLIIAGLAMLLFGKKNNEKNESAEPVGSETEITEPVVSEMTAQDHYAPIIEKYKSAIAEGWTKEQCEIEGISLRVQDGFDVTKAGYAMADLDGDSREELIIAEESTSQTDNIWDLYTTLEDGTPVQLWVDECDGGQCRLYEGNVISIAYSSKHELDFTLYDLKSGQLVMREMLHWEDEDTVLHTDANGNSRQLTSKEGQAISNAYAMQKLELTWLADIPDYLRNTNVVERYMPVLEKYKTALAEKWDMEQCYNNDISPLISWLADTPEDLGVYYMYLDSDSIQEMLILNVNDSTIYDMYTLTDGIPVKLLSGRERNHYSVSTDNHIINRGSGSAFLSVFNDYVLYQGELVLVESVLTDYNADPEKPWFRSPDGDSLGEPLTEQEADAILNGHETARFDATPVLEIP